MIKKTKGKMALVLCALIGFTACSSHKEEKSEIGKYNISSPLLMDTSFTKEYVAQLQAIQNIEIRAKVKGYLGKINVDEGQRVKAGQILFNIEPIEFQAELLKTKEIVKAAEVELQNVKTLADKNIVSQSQLELAVATLEHAKAELIEAELNLSYTDVKAAFDGIIDRIRFKVGSLIDEGTLLTSLSNNKEIYAYFNVSESEYLDFQNRTLNNANDSVTLLLANNQLHKYKGIIQTTAGEFDSNTGNIAFRAKFPNPKLLLKHGETGKVQVKVDLKNVIVIPQKTTFEIQDKIYVYVVDQNNVIKPRNISVKQKLSNVYVIESGVTENDKILLEGVQNVNEGDQIETEFIPPRQALAQLQLIRQ